MSENRFVGWFSLNALTSALLLCLLLFFDPLHVLAKDKQGAVLLILGLAVVAVLLGIPNIKSGPGFVGGVGGIVLLVLIGLAWGFLSISPQSTPNQPNQPIVVEQGPVGGPVPPNP